MKICPRHNVPIHVYTTFEFCPECEKEPKLSAEQVGESMERVKKFDQMVGRIQRKPLQMPNPPTLNAPGYPLLKPSSPNSQLWLASDTADEEELCAIIREPWPGGKSCQWSYLYRDVSYAEDELLRVTDRGKHLLVRVHTVPQAIDWHPLFKNSRQQWTVWRAGTTVLSASAKKVEIIRTVAEVTV